MFKIGVGPSSSHTLGPWRAANLFLNSLQQKDLISKVIRLEVLLYGSLAKTGKGHGTDIAIQLGLSGEDPVTFDVSMIDPKINYIKITKKLKLNGKYEIDFEPAEDIEFLLTESLPYHSNALTFLAVLNDDNHIAETYYSVGGGFVHKEGEPLNDDSNVILPFPINDAHDLLHWCMKTGMNISEVVLENENAWRSEQNTRIGLLRIWDVMKESIFQGCHTFGMLPGGLNVKRRAALLNKKLLKDKQYNDYNSWIKVIQEGGNDFKYILDWVCLLYTSPSPRDGLLSRMPSSA